MQLSPPHQFLVASSHIGRIVVCGQSSIVSLVLSHGCALLLLLSTAACHYRQPHPLAPEATNPALTFIVQVSDETGSPFPGIVVTLTGPGLVASGQSRTTDVRGSAAFTIPLVGSGESRAGSYTVHVEIAGYKPVIHHLAVSQISDGYVHRVKLEAVRTELLFIG